MALYVKLDFGTWQLISNPEIIPEIVYRNAVALFKWANDQVPGNVGIQYAKNPALPARSYEIRYLVDVSSPTGYKYHIEWNGNERNGNNLDVHYNSAAYASAAIAERIYGAVAILPGAAGIKVNVIPLKPFQLNEVMKWIDPYFMNCWFNINQSGVQQRWFQWHHVPTEGLNNTALKNRHIDQIFPNFPNIANVVQREKKRVYKEADEGSPFLDLYFDDINSNKQTGAGAAGVLTGFQTNNTAYTDNMLGAKAEKGTYWVKHNGWKWFIIDSGGKVALNPATDYGVRVNADVYPGTFAQFSFSDYWAKKWPSELNADAGPVEGITIDTKIDWAKKSSPKQPTYVAQKLWDQFMLTRNYIDTAVNLFEQDGTNFFWLATLQLSEIAPEYHVVTINGTKYRLVDGEGEKADPEFASVIRYAIIYGAASNGLSFPFTANPHKFLWWRNNHLKIWKKVHNNQQVNAEDWQIRLNSGSVTNDRAWLVNKLVNTHYYIQAYKEIESYFKVKCAETKIPLPRFRVLAYANYHFLPENVNVDLTNFDVYYTVFNIAKKPGSNNYPETENLQRWKDTGARIIWRPNAFYQSRQLPYYAFNSWFKLLEYGRNIFSGIFIDGYTPANGSGSQAINFYLMARGLRGVSLADGINEFCSSFGAEKQLVNNFVDIISQKLNNQKPTAYPEYFPLNRPFWQQLTDSLNRYSNKNTYGWQYLDVILKVYDFWLKYQEVLPVDYKGKSAVKTAFSNFLKSIPSQYPQVANFDITGRLLASIGTINEATGTENGMITLGIYRPLNTISPVVSGKPVMGQTLSATVGAWQSVLPLEYKYQWRRNGLHIAGANTASYVVISADLNTRLDCYIEAKNGYGSSFCESNFLIAK
jgi:hypothetical protein